VKGQGMFGLGKSSGKAEPILYDSGYFSASKEDCDKLTNDKLAYVADESRQFLQAIWDSNGRLTQKVSFLLGVIIAIFGLVFTEVVLKPALWNGMQRFDRVLLSLYMFVLAVIGAYLLKYQLPLLSHASGTQPSDLLTRKSKIMDHDYREIVLSRLEAYQDSVEYNRQQNTELAKLIGCCYKWMLGYPAIATILHVLWSALVS
jgi:hypothetical protein